MSLLCGSERSLFRSGRNCMVLQCGPMSRVFKILANREKVGHWLSNPVHDNPTLRNGDRAFLDGRQQGLKVIWNEDFLLLLLL